MNLTIKWPYIIKNEHRSYEVKINTNMITDDDYDVPFLLSNLYAAVFANNINFDNKPIEELCNEYFKSVYFSSKTNIFSKICKLSELISYIPFLIINNIKDKRNYVLYDSNNIMCQPNLDAYIKEYTDLFSSYVTFLKNNEESENLYKKLTECLKKYKSSDKLLKKYLIKRGGKCFATFICNKGKYIAFSGMVDFDYHILNSYLKKDNSDHIKIFKSICNDLGAYFVQTELRDCLYELCHCCLKPNIYMTLDDAIIRQKSYEFIGDNFSCCERKIFGYFDNKTPDGQLYVKFKMCNRCELGLYYQSYKNNSSIQVFDGLYIL